MASVSLHALGLASNDALVICSNTSVCKSSTLHETLQLMVLFSYSVIFSAFGPKPLKQRILDSKWQNVSIAHHYNITAFLHGMQKGFERKSGWMLARKSRDSFCLFIFCWLFAFLHNLLALKLNTFNPATRTAYCWRDALLSRCVFTQLQAQESSSACAD